MGCGASRATSGTQDAGAVDPGGIQASSPKQSAVPKDGAAQPTQKRPSADFGSQQRPAALQAPPTSQLPKSQDSSPSLGTPLAVAEPIAPGEQAPEPTTDSPVRLLLVEGFAQFTESVPCYEHLPAGSFVDVPFQDYLDRCAADTAVISWRWARPKPPDLQTARNAEACPVPLPLVEYVVGRARRDGIKYLWLDWSCAPQYPQDLGATMREINRSGQYYATSRGFYVWCFAARVTPEEFQHSDYFCRAWTLSERLHRAKAKAALRAMDFLPAALGDLFTAPLAVMKPSEWMPTMHVICCLLDSNEDGIDEPALRMVSRMVLQRYPLLDRVVSALEDPLRVVLRPDVLAALRGCALLRALVDWTAVPCELSDELLSAYGYTPLRLKGALLHTAVDDVRKALNNYSSDLQGEVLAGGVVFDAYRKLQDGLHEGASLLLQPVGELWQKALGAPTAESAVSPAWLRVYLVFGAGRAYRAFAAPDLLFAIYKLFLSEDYSYGQEAELYDELVRVAQCRWLGRPEAGPYDWLKELADLTADETGVVSSLLEAAVNARTHPADIVSPANFGIIAPGRTRSGSLEQQQRHKQLAVPELFGGEEYRDNVFTHVLGFYLDPATQQALSRRPGFSLVPKATGGEIDSHLSLRGRESLGRFEGKLHAALTKVCAQPWQEDCGLFIVLRYGTMMCLSKCVVMRVSRQPAEEGEDGGWVVEQLAAFGSEAQKGSSWGIAQSLQLLVEDIFSLPGSKAVSYKSYGTDGITPHYFEVEEPKSEHFAAADGAAWFSGFKVAFRTNRAAPAPAPEPEEQKQPQQEAASGNEGGGEMPPAKPATGGGDTADALLAILGAIPSSKGEKNFDDDEIRSVEQAYDRMLRSGFASDGLNGYYEAVSRNYVHDSLMAQHLGYYAKLCGVYTKHLHESGTTLLQVRPLREKFKYMEEDLSDAIDMASDDPQKEAATAALAELSGTMRALREAAGDDSD